MLEDLLVEGVRRHLDGMILASSSVSIVLVREPLWQSDSTQTRICPKHNFTESNEGPAAGKEDKNDSYPLMPRPGFTVLYLTLASLYFPLPNLWTEIAPLKRKFGQIVENDTFIRQRKAVGVKRE